MFCPLFGNGTVREDLSISTFTCTKCKHEGKIAIDEAAVDRQRPFVRECVDCHAALLTEDIYCRRCGSRYDVWITRAEQGK